MDTPTTHTHTHPQYIPLGWRICPLGYSPSPPVSQPSVESTGSKLGLRPTGPLDHLTIPADGATVWNARPPGPRWAEISRFPPTLTVYMLANIQPGGGY